ncbi:hypothetical protein AAE478_006438 [Parahypoxylon ruwenzoriense]
MCVFCPHVYCGNCETEYRPNLGGFLYQGERNDEALQKGFFGPDAPNSTSFDQQAPDATDNSIPWTSRASSFIAGDSVNNPPPLEKKDVFNRTTAMTSGSETQSLPASNGFESFGASLLIRGSRETFDHGKCNPHSSTHAIDPANLVKAAEPPMSKPNEQFKESWGSSSGLNAEIPGRQFTQSDSGTPGQFDADRNDWCGLQDFCSARPSNSLPTVGPQASVSSDVDASWDCRVPVPRMGVTTASIRGSQFSPQHEVSSSVPGEEQQPATNLRRPSQKHRRTDKITSACDSCLAVIHTNEKMPFACPFYKRDPRQHSRCMHKGLTDIGKVKEHLVKYHPLVNQLSRTTKVSASHNKKWYWMWRRLFGEIIPAPSCPYMHPEEDFRAWIYTQLPRDVAEGHVPREIVSQLKEVLGQRTHPNGQPFEYDANVNNHLPPPSSPCEFNAGEMAIKESAFRSNGGLGVTTTVPYGYDVSGIASWDLNGPF